MGLKLKIIPQSTTVSELLDFAGNDVVSLVGAVDSSLNKKIEFSMWMDTSIYADHGSFGAGVIKTVPSTADYFVASLYNSQMRFYCTVNATGNAYINIDNSFVDKILNFEIQKSESSINFIKINGVEQTKYAMTGLSPSVQSAFGSFSDYLYSATLWDVILTDIDTDTAMHQWIGHPVGNTNTAWVDQVGSINGNVNGSPGTRDITEVSGGGTSSTTNKLSIVHGTSDLGGVGDFANDFITMIATGQGGSDDFRRGANFKWKMWLDNDTGYSNDLFNLDSSTGNPTGHLKAWMIDSSLYISVVGIAYNAYDITGLDNQILDCELTGGFGTYPQEFKINDGVQSGTNTIPTITSHGGIYIGSCTLLAYGQNLDSLDNGTVWDIQTETSLGVPTHGWLGYPAGNTLGAWEDTVGTIDATLMGPTGTRDIEGGGTSGTGNKLMISPRYEDWFLPSKDELQAMYDNLKAESVGDFEDYTYWSSSQHATLDTHSFVIQFSNGGGGNLLKGSENNVRACRSFTAGVGAFALRDTGPTGGLIFYVDGGTTYYEAAPSDQAYQPNDDVAWSNITDVSVATLDGIGTGITNSEAIMAQPGHITSAAKLCNDLVITR